MNEYPRLGALWLQRFPFTAEYGALLRNDVNQPLFLPIYGNGEISGRINDVQFTTDAVPLVDRYEFPRLTLTPVPAGVSELVLRYRFSDDDATRPPDVAPSVRGPYATLKVGTPQDRDSLLEFVQLRIRGWALDTAGERTPDSVVAVDSTGRELGRSQPQERPDVAAYVGLPTLTASGFNFAIPARSVLNDSVKIKAVYGSTDILIGTVSGAQQFLPDLPVVQVEDSLGEQGDFQVWFDADRSDLVALAPEYVGKVGLGLRFLLMLIDGASLLIIGGLLTALSRSIRTTVPTALLFGFATLGLVSLGGQVAPEVLGSRLFVPLLILAVFTAVVVRRRPMSSLLTCLPAAVVLASYKSFDHLERFHGGKGERWWGRLLYYWRDSDWYATQGYARTVFLEGSLQGGEALFWFQAGPRYLALATRVLLGENDVLVGIIMTSLGFFAVFVLFVRSQVVLRNLSHQVIAGVALFILLFFMADDLMAGFGFVGSSEYPTWTALLLITGFIIATRSETRPWLMVAMAIALGYSIQLRPNQIGGIVLLFAALLLLVDRRDTPQAIATASKMTVAFVTLVLFSLLHNLYYGESFVPFTANAGINYQFSWLDVLGINQGDATLAAVWDQLRVMMYWNSVGNWSWALMFWGSQLLWVVVVVHRIRDGLARRARSLLLLIPFGYALPMLKYQMGSYYPRHLVVINLSFMCAALMAWPRDNEMFGGETGSDTVGETAESSSASVAVNAAVS
jgi:hypothetical protein